MLIGPEASLSQVYGDDVGRLCDLAREAVAFDTPDGLARCLEAAAADPSVRIVRVRDGGLLAGSAAAGSERSAGFRYLAIVLSYFL